MGAKRDGEGNRAIVTCPLLATLLYGNLGFL